MALFKRPPNEKGSVWFPVAIGVLIQILLVHIPLFTAGRFFAGLGVGLLSALVPLYQSETAPKWIRGLIVGAYQLAITVGILLAAIVKNGTHLRNNTGSYRIPIALQWLLSLILIIGMHFLPETPRYCIKRVNFIFCYGTQFFENSGISSAFLISMILAMVNVLSTIPAALVFDKSGRRPLLLWGGVGMCICQSLVATLGTTTTGQTASGVITVLNVAGQKASVAFWAFNWAIAYSTPYLVNYGPGYANLQSKIFFIWGAACLICVLFVYLFMYETKGLSLEEVDEMYQEPGLKAKDSNKWRPSVHFRIIPLTDVTYHNREVTYNKNNV
ncbi:hypothetical protein SMACR_09196 [Sordaria macrospora]|uniref:WGS project CABT00000000 data, contig 2.76 n=2 Tax=Sordaria macrospora TaxID=5147 RepID=F7WBH4_SORMK|nr:uncharacterized protein SMAC_09196 [Sordaria macrospora k-hell]KAA8635558.1 hypothetical protein SMACR_09196 [Sordaria macrospora]KAH7629482.1 hypothetical protein B0T09DRAFT_266382 [Sordaria sp. MPI-SDFR-AT-0083]WPJ66302.1 hypothetical protein SMAC4_09196 [Sordaria macrospora]CCC14415.1 unnamed protein product [Sordaria macrospora k-hell]